MADKRLDYTPKRGQKNTPAPFKGERGYKTTVINKPI